VQVFVQVEHQGDLGAVVQHLTVDVRHERGHRRVGVWAHGGPARPDQALVAERPDAVDPQVVVGVHEGEHVLGRARPVRRRVVEAAGPEVVRARSPNTRAMWASRQPMVASGAGVGSGTAKSIATAPAPTAMGDVA